MSDFDRTNVRAYARELGVSLLLYALLLVLSVLWLQHGVPGPWQSAVALLPMAAFAVLFWTVLRMYRRMDELQRTRFLETIALGFFGTAFLTFAYGFLEGVGFPRVSMHLVWVCMGSLWFLLAVGRQVAASWTTH